MTTFSLQRKKNCTGKTKKILMSYVKLVFFSGQKSLFFFSEVKQFSLVESVFLPVKIFFFLLLVVIGKIGFIKR